MPGVRPRSNSESDVTRSAKAPILLHVGVDRVILMLVGPADRYFGARLLPATRAGNSLKAEFLERNQLQTFRSGCQFCVLSQVGFLDRLD
jgi:hypothetical protein